jgi:sporulation protein YlmC with PRC-barrel domain
MKRFTTLAFSAAIIAGLTLDSATAQNQTVQERAGTSAGRLDAKTHGSNIRVSQLLGANIQNSQGESVGEINDIVLDSQTGKVNYAAVTYGGFLGVGNKLFAVPFEAFRVQVDPSELRDGANINEAHDYVLVLDVTQQQLEGQQGFDEDNWPNMADKQWAADLDKRYRIDRNLDEKERLLRNSRDRSNE